MAGSCPLVRSKEDSLEEEGQELRPDAATEAEVRSKEPAKAEASAAAMWKYARKCVASWLLMASSAPKHAEY